MLVWAYRVSHCDVDMAVSLLEHSVGFTTLHDHKNSQCPDQRMYHWHGTAVVHWLTAFGIFDTGSVLALSQVEPNHTLLATDICSLYCSQINLYVCHATCMSCLGPGNNHLSKLDRMIYLRQFHNLELVNLAGNPLCREANYRAYMLSHIKRLKFLDYVRVNPDDVGAAFEHYQVWNLVDTSRKSA